MAIPNSQFTIRHISQLGSRGTEKFYTTLTAEQIANDSDTAVALDSFVRAVVALSTDTYEDTIFLSKLSIDTE